MGFTRFAFQNSLAYAREFFVREFFFFLDPKYRWAGKVMMYSIEKYAKTACGYATISDIRSMEKSDEMESFFLAETLKYLYLLFDENNPFHNVNKKKKKKKRNL